MPQAEEILADRWALVEKIDEGAMGEIFSARHAVLGHSVAVKVLMPTVSRDKASVERFLREARIAAKLQHHNVVRVEDFGLAADGRPFLVMELLRGESLARRLARAPRPTDAEAVEIVRQIAAAIDAAHVAGIVHRDLKPENVFLANERGGAVVKVLDFGVAKFTDTLANGGHATASNTLIGTPRYMSPEQARSLRELDGRTDVWSLGMIAYEMITGSHPFEGEAIAELLVAILTHRIPAPSTLRPELPAAFDAWAERALARSRYDRFSTGRELVDALVEALAGRLDERWAGFAYERARDTASRGGSNGGTVRARRPTPVTEVIRARRATPDIDAMRPRRATPDVDVMRQRRATPDIEAMRPRRATPMPEAPPAPVAAPLKLTPAEGQLPVLAAPAEPLAPLAPAAAVLAETVEAPQAQPDPPSPPPPPRASWWIAAAAALVAGLGLIVAIRVSGVTRAVRHPAAAILASETGRAVDPPAAPPRPEPVPSIAVAPAAAPVAAPAPPAPAAVATPVDEAPVRRRGSHRHRSRHHHGATAEAPNERRSLYDPPGI
ncbi:MAG: serine/threonine-protein kinase [Polyangiales bacterium]